MPARRVAKRRTKRPDLADPPAGIAPDDPVPNLGNADRSTVERWDEWARSALPDVDPFDLLLAAPGVTVADVLADPLGFRTLLDD